MKAAFALPEILMVIHVLFDTVIIEAEGKLFFYTFSPERLILR
jgi:hypothetical protein